MNTRAVKTALAPSQLATLLESVPAGLRGPLLMSVASFRPSATVESSFAVGEFRAAFTGFWESRVGCSIPLAHLRATLEPPVPIRTAIEFNKFATSRNAAEIDAYLAKLVQYLDDGHHRDSRLISLPR